ncbi:MAG: hypothetical protein KAS66_16195, partial [Candidatus Omnitrophica bacterium]|nr:hypothetical protein [Candidatus Omnitrophota bacterium]
GLPIYQSRIKMHASEIYKDLFNEKAPLPNEELYSTFIVRTREIIDERETEDGQIISEPAYYIYIQEKIESSTILNEPATKLIRNGKLFVKVEGNRVRNNVWERTLMDRLPGGFIGFYKEPLGLAMGRYVKEGIDVGRLINEFKENKQPGEGRERQKDKGYIETITVKSGLTLPEHIFEEGARKYETLPYFFGVLSAILGAIFLIQAFFGSITRLFTRLKRVRNANFDSIERLAGLKDVSEVTAAKYILLREAEGHFVLGANIQSRHEVEEQVKRYLEGLKLDEKEIGAIIKDVKEGRTIGFEKRLEEAGLKKSEIEALIKDMNKFIKRIKKEEKAKLKDKKAISGELRNCLNNAGLFDESEIKTTISRVNDGTLIFGEIIDNDVALRQEAPELDEGKPLVEQIEKAANKAYEKAVVIQSFIEGEMIVIKEGEDIERALRRLLNAKKIASKEKGIRWETLKGAVVRAAEDKISANMVDGQYEDKKKLEDDLKKLSELAPTPQVRMLRYLLNTDYFGEGTFNAIIDALIKYREKDGSIDTFQDFIVWYVKDIIRTRFMEDVYDKTYGAVKESRILEKDLEDITWSVVSEIHRFVMIDPSRLPRAGEANKAFNPYPITPGLEPATLMELGMLKLMQMVQSKTNKYSFGAIAVQYPLAIFVVRYMIKLMNKTGEDDSLKQADVARIIMRRIKVMVRFWELTFYINHWYQSSAGGKTRAVTPGLFKLVTEDHPWQPKFRLTHIFQDSDVYELFIGLMDQGDEGCEEFERLIYKLTNKNEEQIESEAHQKYLEDATKKLKGIFERYNELNQKYLGAGAKKETDNAYKRLLENAEEEVLPFFNPLLHAAEKIAEEKAPYSFAADQKTKTHRGVIHLIGYRILGPIFAGGLVARVLRIKGKFKTLKHFFGIKNPWVRGLIVAISIAGFVSGLHYILVERLISIGLLSIFLSFGLPTLIFGKVKFASEKVLWVSLFSITSMYQALIAHHLFWKLAIINFTSFGFWITLGLFMLITPVTFISLGNVFTSFKSYVVLNARTWSPTARSIWGWKSLFRLRVKAEKVNGKFYKIRFKATGIYNEAFFTKWYREFIDYQRKYGYLLPNRELIQEYFTRTVEGMPETDIHPGERRKLLNFVQDPDNKNYVFIMPESDKGKNALFLTMFTLSQKKPQSDVFGHLQATSAHVQSAYEIFAHTMEAEWSFGSFDLPGKFEALEKAITRVVVETRGNFTMSRERKKRKIEELKKIVQNNNRLENLIDALQSSDELSFQDKKQIENIFAATSNSVSMKLINQIQEQQQEIYENVLTKVKRANKGLLHEKIVNILARRDSKGWVKKLELAILSYPGGWKDMAKDIITFRMTGLFRVSKAQKTRVIKEIFEALRDELTVQEKGGYKDLVSSLNTEIRRLELVKNTSLGGYVARAYAVEFSNVLAYLKEMPDVDKNRPGVLAKAAYALEEIDEYSDFNEILFNNPEFDLTSEELSVIKFKLQGFLDEVRPSNISVMASFVKDITEMHIYTAGQFEDYAYQQAVQKISTRYESLESAYRKITRQDPDLRVSVDHIAEFKRKYKSYQDRVKLKYRAIFHVEPLWREYASKVNGGYRMNMMDDLVDEDQVKGSVIFTKLRQELDDKGMLRVEQNKKGEDVYYVVTDSLEKFSEVIWKFRKKFLRKLIEENNKVEKERSEVKEERSESEKERSELKEKRRKLKEAWQKTVIVSRMVHKADILDIKLPFYDRTQDNMISNNKNGGMGTNLSLMYGRSQNNDGLVRTHHGNNIYRINWASYVGRNPAVVVVNPLMRVWTSTYWAFEVSKVYNIAQETFTSDVQRGRRGLTTFYGKGFITPAAGDTMLASPGEDTAAFLSMQAVYPKVMSIQFDWLAFEWGRPSLKAESIDNTEQRYAFNVTRFLMDRLTFEVFENEDIGYDVKLTHLNFFMHYLSTLIGIPLLIFLISGAIFSSFAYLSPIWLWVVLSTFLMNSININNFVRHLRLSGSFLFAVWRTIFDIFVSFSFYVSLLISFFKGIIYASNEKFFFIRTVKGALLSVLDDKQRHDNTSGMKFNVSRSKTPGKVLFYTGIITAIAGSIGLMLSPTWVAAWLSVAGPIEAFLGVLMNSQFKEKLPVEIIVANLSIASWMFALFFATPFGPAIFILYMFAAVTFLTGAFSYKAHVEKGQLKGINVAAMFGRFRGMAVFLLANAILLLTGAADFVTAETIFMNWVLIIIGLFTFFTSGATNVFKVQKWGLQDLMRFLFAMLVKEEVVGIRIFKQAKKLGENTRVMISKTRLFEAMESGFNKIVNKLAGVDTEHREKKEYTGEQLDVYVFASNVFVTAKVMVGVITTLTVWLLP